MNDAHCFNFHPTDQDIQVKEEDKLEKNVGLLYAQPCEDHCKTVDLDSGSLDNVPKSCDPTELCKPLIIEPQICMDLPTGVEKGNWKLELPEGITETMPENYYLKREEQSGFEIKPSISDCAEIGQKTVPPSLNSHSILPTLKIQVLSSSGKVYKLAVKNSEPIETSVLNSEERTQRNIVHRSMCISDVAVKRKVPTGQVRTAHHFLSGQKLYIKHVQNVKSNTNETKQVKQKEPTGQVPTPHQSISDQELYIQHVQNVKSNTNESEEVKLNEPIGQVPTTHQSISDQGLYVQHVQTVKSNTNESEEVKLNEPTGQVPTPHQSISDQELYIQHVQNVTSNTNESEQVKLNEPTGQVPTPHQAISDQELYIQHVQNVKSNTNESKDVDPPFCHICNKQFPTKWTLDSHMVMHDPKKPHECHVCGFRFSELFYLVKHAKTHVSESYFPCGICEETFTTEELLAKHRKGHKLELWEKQACEVCGKMITANWLKKHAKKHEMEELEKKEVHNCYRCNKEYSSIAALNSHMIACRGVQEKPFICEVCGEAFRNACFLEYHMTEHKGDITHWCSICGEGFTSVYHLSHHNTKHHYHETCNKCEQCGKEFFKKSTLNRHMRLHSKDRPYGCSVCPSRFNSESTLEKHMEIHKREANFSCDKCGEKFQGKGPLKVHMTQQHDLFYLCRRKKRRSRRYKF